MPNKRKRYLHTTRVQAAPSLQEDFRNIFPIIFTLFGIILSALYGVILSGLHNQSYVHRNLTDALLNLTKILGSLDFEIFYKLFIYSFNAFIMCMTFYFLIMAYMKTDDAIKALGEDLGPKYSTKSIGKNHGTSVALYLMLMMISSVILPLEISAYDYMVYSLVIDLFMILFFVLIFISRFLERSTINA
ncbi:MAG: hypothetical protein M0R70_02525 [Nitrospirae bacterium]|nr:hypothetical protein [Nitrospirota bacterium]